MKWSHRVAYGKGKPGFPVLQRLQQLTLRQTLEYFLPEPQVSGLATTAWCIFSFLTASLPVEPSQMPSGQVFLSPACEALPLGPSSCCRQSTCSTVQSWLSPCFSSFLRLQSSGGLRGNLGAQAHTCSCPGRTDCKSRTH